MSFNIERGRQGEQAAAEYLLEHGFEILHRNWRSGHYELDIVAVRDGVLHVVEVKCRKKDSLTAPEEALTPAKQRSLLRAAAGYAALYRIESDVRIDLVAVEMDENSEFEIRYVPDAVIPRW